MFVIHPVLGSILSFPELQQSMKQHTVLQHTFHMFTPLHASRFNRSIKAPGPCMAGRTSHNLHVLLITFPRSAGASELTVPTFAWRSGALATTAYYLLSHVAETLSHREAKTLLTILFIGHGLLADVLGRPLDFTQPIARILHGVLNVPIPAHNPAPSISDQSGGKEDKKKK